jgi:hypothetical protein
LKTEYSLTSDWLLRDVAVHEPHYSLSDLSVTKIEHSSDIGAYAIDSLKKEWGTLISL